MDVIPTPWAADLAEKILLYLNDQLGNVDVEQHFHDVAVLIEVFKQDKEQTVG